MIVNYHLTMMSWLTQYIQENQLAWEKRRKIQEREKKEKLKAWERMSKEDPSLLEPCREQGGITLVHHPSEQINLLRAEIHRTDDNESENYKDKIGSEAEMMDMEQLLGRRSNERSFCLTYVMDPCLCELRRLEERIEYLAEKVEHKE